MPIYEYVCEKCEQRFEELVQSSRGSERFACPSCGHGATQRVLSVFATHQSSPEPPVAAPMGGCGRCGDPHGPCGMS